MLLSPCYFSPCVLLLRRAVSSGVRPGCAFTAAAVWMLTESFPHANARRIRFGQLRNLITAVALTLCPSPKQAKCVRGERGAARRGATASELFPKRRIRTCFKSQTPGTNSARPKMNIWKHVLFLSILFVCCSRVKWSGAGGHSPPCVANSRREPDFRLAKTFSFFFFFNYQNTLHERWFSTPPVRIFKGWHRCNVVCSHVP